MKSKGVFVGLLLLTGCQGEKVIPSGGNQGPATALPLPANTIVLTEPRDRHERRTYRYICQLELGHVALATLSDREVLTADSLLQESLLQYNNGVRNSGYLHNLVDLTDYKRQFLAYINPKGEKEVWVNCMRSIRDEDGWRKYPILVSDGGNSVYSGRINLSLKKWFGFSINPDA